MTLPVIERISQEVKRRLTPVIPDRNNAIGLAEIARPGRPVSSIASLVVQQRPTKPIPALDYPGNPPAKCYETTFDVNCFIDRPENETDFAAACNKIVSDIVWAITHPEQNPEIWHTFGQLASNATIGQYRDLPNESGVNGGVSVPIAIQYRVSENDHTQVR